MLLLPRVPIPLRLASKFLARIGHQSGQNVRVDLAAQICLTVLWKEIQLKSPVQPLNYLQPKELVG
jgi:hypothetical protein